MEPLDDRFRFLFPNGLRAMDCICFTGKRVFLLSGEYSSAQRNFLCDTYGALASNALDDDLLEGSCEIAGHGILAMRFRKFGKTTFWTVSISPITDVADPA